MEFSTTQPSRYTPLSFLGQSLKAYPADIGKALLAVLLTSASILGVGYGLRTVVDKGLISENISLLNGSTLVFIFLALTLAVSAYLRISTTAWLGEKIVNDLRYRLFSHSIHLEIATFERLRLGDLLARMNADCDQIRSFISGSAAVALRTILQLIGGTILLMISSPKLTLYVFALIPFVIIPLFLFGRKVKALTYQAQNLDGESLSFAEERINALTMLKSFGAEQKSTSIFASLLQKKLSLVKKRTHYRALLVSLVIALVFSAIAGILWVGTHEVIQNNLTAGQLSAFVFYAIVVAGSLNNFAEIMSNFNLTLGSTKRITELLSMPLEQDTIDSQRSNDSLAPVLPFKTLELKNIDFSYPARPDTKVLKDVSFLLKHKQKIAIVGPSGVGKSTLFKILLNFYTPQKGDILLNGQPIHAYSLSSVRSLFASVPQDPVIFNTSILNNIALANPEASKEEILKVAKKAYVDEFADKFPQGYKTELGEKGVRLSGGQKQRIALARALLRDAPIFLLDEATNALDSQSEQHIQSALQKSLKHKSALIIAHRLSTVKEADQIIVLNEKTIEAIGTHAELIKSSKLYKTLAQQQFLDT